MSEPVGSFDLPLPANDFCVTGHVIIRSLISIGGGSKDCDFEKGVFGTITSESRSGVQSDEVGNDIDIQRLIAQLSARHIIHSQHLVNSHCEYS